MEKIEQVSSVAVLVQNVEVIFLFRNADEGYEIRMRS